MGILLVTKTDESVPGEWEKGAQRNLRYNDTVPK